MHPSSSLAIAATRFLIILGPVMIHTQVGFSTDNFLVICGHDLIGQITVPLFYFISGFLFFQKLDLSFSSYISKFKKRIWSLLIPYLLWNLFAFLFYVSVGDMHWGQFGDAFWVVEGKPGHSPADGPFWFIRTLILLLPFTPIMHLINANRYISWFSIVFFVCFIIGIFPFDRGTFIGFACFNLGAFFSLNNYDSNFMNFVNSINQWYLLCCLIFVYVFLGFLDYYYRGAGYLWSVIHNFGICVGAICILVIPLMSSEKTLNILKSLASTSFFIFGFHEPIITYVRDIVIPWVGNGNIGYLFTFLCVVAICLLTYYLLKIIIPKFVILLCGGR